MLALVACSALLAVGLDGPQPPDARQAYEDVRASAGRSSEDQVRLALWCEAHGLTAERLNHLTLAVLADPKNATARGLMGLVAHEGRWRRPEVVAAQTLADPNLAEYEVRRGKAPYTAEGQWTLGVWADEHGLKEQAKAHLTAVVRLDPTRENAWKRLGYKKQGGRWITDAQMAADTAELDAQKLADKTWRPLLDRYKGMLDRPKDREAAEAALSEITDPRAVPAILHAFGTTKAADQIRAVRLLGQVESPSSSRSLAGLAVLAKSAEVRRSAIETLRRRDPRDFVKLWVALIRKPIHYEVKPVGGPGSPGTLLVEGQKANLQRVYAPPPLPTVPNLPGLTLTYDAGGLPVLIEDLGTSRDGRALSQQELARIEANPSPAAAEQRKILASLPPSATPAEIKRAVEEAAKKNRANPVQTSNTGVVTTERSQLQIPIGRMILETQQEAVVAQQQLASDVASIERINDQVRQGNEPILLALRTITGHDLGDDGPAWNRWWTDQMGYALANDNSSSIPTYVENVPIAFTPQASVTIVVNTTISTQPRHSCFAAGTTVRTINGDRAIESIQAGDLVLVLNPGTGALGYQAVITAYHNPPSPTLRVTFEGLEAITATGIHRFWKAGQGWTMARDLKPGDLVRNLEGVARVATVEDDRLQPVFNLEVSEGHSFLVGKLGSLVHDNSLVEATPNPFDAAGAKR